MAQFAMFDPAAGQPAPVIGWYDTGVCVYPNLPSADQLFPLTPTQWASRLTGQWAVADNALVSYVPPLPPATPAQQAEAILNAGLSITSTSTSDLDGLYACDATTQSHIQAELWSIMLNGVFADGSTSVAWPDMVNDTPHVFTSTDAFKAFATAVGAFVAACAKFGAGVTVDLPTASVTIP